MSYYSACSGFGLHTHGGHHRHRFACDVHGYHLYHRRDCSLCYPGGGVHYEYHDAGVYEDVGDQPESGVPPATEAGPEKESFKKKLDPAPPGTTEGVSGEDASTPVAEIPPGPADPLADLSPAKLTVALGILAFREGKYDEASDAFFNASIEASDSAVVKLLLATSLVAISEYEYAALFLRSAYGNPAGPAHGNPGRLEAASIDLRRLYGEGREADFEAHRKLLAERAELFPTDPDTLLLDGFMAMASGDLESAAVSLNAFRMFANSDVDGELAARLLVRVQARRDTAAGAENSPVTGEGGFAADEIDAFFRNPGLKALRELPIR